jgi:hypothetical protein
VHDHGERLIEGIGRVSCDERERILEILRHNFADCDHADCTDKVNVILSVHRVSISKLCCDFFKGRSNFIMIKVSFKLKSDCMISQTNASSAGCVAFCNAGQEVP